MPDESYWTERYQSKQTGWDIGYVSTPLKAYIDQLTDRSIKVLIPGGGNSYEAEYLFKNGFNEVYVIDLSVIPLTNLRQRLPGFPEDHLLHSDFFDHQGQYDLIFEQTFFSALVPDLRPAYAEKMHRLLNLGGKLVGLLFTIPLYSDRPPYGGSEPEYRRYFENLFDIQIMETAYNSIPERSGHELFIKLQRSIR